MITVWALLAVSSDAQAETLQHQRKWAEAVTREKGWRLSRFIEGVASGKDGPRRLARDLLLEVRATPSEARPAYVLLIRLDRLGRGSIVDSQIFARDLLALGTRLFTRDQGEIRLDSAMDELVAAVQMAVARHENDVRRDKAVAVYKRRKAAGQVISNRPPFGLTITKDRKYVALQSHVKVVRRAFEMRGAGHRVVDILRWLNANSPPHRYKCGSIYDVRWSDARLGKMLQNRAYIGAVVDEQMWLAAQRRRLESYVGRAPRKDRRNGEFALAGVMRCFCGRGIAAVAYRRRGGVFARFYTCRAAWNHGGKGVHHRADDVETRFAVFLARLADETLARPVRVGSAEMLERVEQHVSTLRGKLETIERSRTRVWKLDDAGHLDARDLAERLADLNARKADVESQLVRAIEERTVVEAARLRESEFSELHRCGAVRYEFGTIAERAVIGREVATSFGGLRLTKDGKIVVGARPGYIWNRRRTRHDAPG
jgi:DNA invertase Pin-like site-specific DNA recombinase